MCYQKIGFSILFGVLVSFSACEAQLEIPFANLDENIDIIVGANIPIQSKFNHLPIVEPTIAAHPENSAILLAAAMIVTDVKNPYESCRLSSFYSDDGGNAWQEIDHDYWGYDPWVSILPNGSASMSWLGTARKFKHQFPLQLFRSSDSGKSWDNEVEHFRGFGHGHDGTKLVGHKDAFYLTVVRFNGNMGADVVLYESKNGQGFKEVGAIGGNGKRLNFCEPAILSNGSVVVPTMHGSENIWANIYDPNTKNMSERYVISEQPKLGRGYSRMAVDNHSSSRYKDRLYFVRAVAKGSSSAGVWLNYSNDGGRTWTKEKRVDLFDKNLPSKANIASVAVNNEGILGISWVDGQHSEDQKSYDVYFTISKDGGEHFQEPVRITNVSSNPRTTQNDDVSNKFIGGGHYMGITTKANGNFQLIWSDSRDGYFKLQTCDIEIAESSF